MLGFIVPVSPRQMGVQGNRVQLIFDRQGQAWAVIVENERTTFYGNPPQDVMALLER
jgi:hypothetical protein